MQAIQLKDVKQGEFFTRKPIDAPKDSQVFIRRYYEKSEKKYFCERFCNFCDGIFLKGSTIVYIDFYF